MGGVSGRDGMGGIVWEVDMGEIFWGEVYGSGGFVKGFGSDILD